MTQIFISISGNWNQSNAAHTSTYEHKYVCGKTSCQSLLICWAGSHDRPSDTLDKVSALKIYLSKSPKALAACDDLADACNYIQGLQEIWMSYAWLQFCYWYLNNKIYMCCTSTGNTKGHSTRKTEQIYVSIDKWLLV